MQSGFAERIREARLSAGLTQAGLASAAGYSLEAVKTWEAGTRHPRQRNLEVLANVLGHDVAWFYSTPGGQAA